MHEFGVSTAVTYEDKHTVEYAPSGLVGCPKDHSAADAILWFERHNGPSGDSFGSKTGGTGGVSLIFHHNPYLAKKISMGDKQ